MLEHPAWSWDATLFSPPLFTSPLICTLLYIQNIFLGQRMGRPKLRTHLGLYLSVCHTSWSSASSSSSIYFIKFLLIGSGNLSDTWVSIQVVPHNHAELPRTYLSAKHYNLKKVLVLFYVLFSLRLILIVSICLLVWYRNWSSFSSSFCIWVKVYLAHNSMV